ncbi:MAG: HD domain-containing protein [Desulfovibrio sp.]|jgi:HD-GYP domain-containing protein (c-di-GMP phosphodiesterase class II)|nr:HD domain-containing protein [Desulfovibrio sp.]
METNISSFNINSVSLIRSLSMSLGLAVDGITHHHWRAAAICQYISGSLKLPVAEKQRLFCAALLHDIGAASSMDERQKLGDPNLETRASIHDHAEEGYNLLKSSPCFNDLAESVRYHHHAWLGGNPSGLRGDFIPLNSRIIYVADRVEILLDPRKPVLSQSDGIKEFIREGRGTRYDPMVVDAFLYASRKDSFWLDMGNPEYMNTFFNGLRNLGLTGYSASEMLHIAGMFAKLIDRMSAFTATHSKSVSLVAVLLASEHSFSETELCMMEIAGLLHDLGKLAVPNSILEKPGALTKEEMRTMRQHTYFTYRILENMDNLGPIPAWAAFHHETLDGAGYPFMLNETALSLGSRIMSVADIFVALAEDRPYRKRLEKNMVRKIMLDMAGNHKIDGRVVGVLLDLYQQADDIVLSLTL